MEMPKPKTFQYELLPLLLLLPFPSLYSLNSLSLSLEIKLSLTAQRNRLRSFIQTMHDEGIVNDQFCELQYMEEIIGRDYVVRVITRFCVACIATSNRLIFRRFMFLLVNYMQEPLGVPPFCFLSKMAMAILKELLQGYLNSLYDEGLLNDHFLSLKDTSEPEYVVQTIEKYFADVEMILSELSCHVDKSKVDFCRLASLVREIEDKSISIGAEHMKLACSVLIKACDEKNKRSFSRSVLWLGHEFGATRNKLAAVVQMERRIMRVGSSKSRN